MPEPEEETVMRNYRLHSSEMANAPGIVQLALNELKQEDPVKRLWAIMLLLVGFPTLPSGVVYGIADGIIELFIDPGTECVNISINDKQERMLGLPNTQKVKEAKAADIVDVLVDDVMGDDPVIERVMRVTSDNTESAGWGRGPLTDKFLDTLMKVL